MSLPTNFFLARGAVKLKPGEARYTVANTYTFVVPKGVTQIHALAIGGGNGGGGYAQGCGGGGALGWKNNVSVQEGETLTITVGNGGSWGGFHGGGSNGGDTTITGSVSGNLVGAEGGKGGSSVNRANPMYGSSGGSGGHLQQNESWFTGGGGAGGKGGLGGKGEGGDGGGALIVYSMPMPLHFQKLETSLIPLTYGGCAWYTPCVSVQSACVGQPELSAQR